MNSFEAIDKWLDGKLEVPRLSLNPNQELANSFHNLSETAFTLSGTDSYEITAEVWKYIAKELVKAFPENIFWDFDYMFCNFVNSLESDLKPEQYAEEYQQLVGELLHCFGKHSNIRFRYIHDFTYGFDWAKWVQKDAPRRKKIAPFSLSFLQRLLERGEELEHLISQNDIEYPKLEKKEQFRNPFLFSREPQNEKLLLEALALRGKIPVENWSSKSVPSYSQQFSKIREEVSMEMGI